MALVSLRDALARGAVPPPTAPAPAPQPTPPPDRPGPTPTGTALSTTGSLLSAYNGLGRMFPGLNLGQIPYANWMSALLNVGAGAANDGVRGAARGTMNALPGLVRNAAQYQFGPTASMLANPGALNWANLGLTAAGFGINMLGNQRLSNAYSTLAAPVGSALSIMAAPAYAGAAVVAPFFGGLIDNLLTPAKTREQVFAELMDSHPAFGANRIGETQEHAQGANLGYLGGMAGLRGMRSSGVINGVDTNAAWNYARAWTLADVMANPYGTMVPNRSGEGHEYAYGPNRQVPTRDPRVLGQMLDDDLDIYDTNWGAQLGEGANGGLPGRLTFLDAEQRARIQRQGTLTEPVMPGEPLYNYNTNTV